MTSHVRRLALGNATAAALLLRFCVCDAIEAPDRQPASQPPVQQQPFQIIPTDEAAFYEKLRRVTHHRNLRGLRVPDAVIAALADGNADAAVTALGGLAEQGTKEANVALVHVQHWCSGVASARPTDPQEQLAKLNGDLPAPRAARIAGVLRAEVEFLKRARTACTRAAFDYRGIEARLRAAAAAGDPASAVELSRFLRDPAQRDALLQSAVKKNYPPAQHQAATNLLVAVQRGQTTENVSRVRELLKQAGRSIPKAKLDLANCMALGCDGHPADAFAARAFGLDAARDGEPAAFASMVRMPWGARMPRSQLLAWQYFGDRLNEAGCLGDAFVPSTITFAQTMALLEKDQDAKLIEDARKQAEGLWHEHGERAMEENGCR